MMDECLKNYTISKPLLYTFLVTIGLISGFKLSEPNHYFIKRISSTANTFPSAGAVDDVIGFIDSKYLLEIDKEQLIEVAVERIMDELDPHSAYLSKDGLRLVNQQMKGQYTGLGIETLQDGDTLVVTTILKDSPAAKSTLELFDRIIAINGVQIAQLERSWLPANENELTTLTIRRDLTKERMDISIPAGQVSAESSCEAFMIQDSIAFVRINQFNANVYKDFNYALESLDRDNMAHLIVDLRGNPGGYLPETAKIASLFFEEKDKLIVTTIDKNDRKSEYKSTGRQFYPIDKLAILVDQESASGSEILAGAVQDWDRGIIIGQPTYGKGLVQEQFPLRNGAALRLTVAKYLTPSGRFIQKSDDHIERDSTEYFSLQEARRLVNQAGIFPDSLVDIPTDCPSPLVNSIGYTAYQIVRKQQWHLGFKPAALQGLNLNHLVGMAIDNDHVSFNLEDPCMQELEYTLKFEILTTLMSRSQARQELYTDDRFILEAMEYIKS